MELHTPRLYLWAPLPWGTGIIGESVDSLHCQRCGFEKKTQQTCSKPSWVPCRSTGPGTHRPERAMADKIEQCCRPQQ